MNSKDLYIFSGSSLTRRPSESLSRRNSRDELNKLSVPTIRYTGSTSLNRYGSSTSSISPKTDSKLYSTSSSRRSPIPTSITSSSRTLSTNYPSNSSSHSRSTSQDFTSLIQKSDDDNTSVASTVESLKNDSTYDEMITVTVMTRATSPTPPSSSNSYGTTRSKRSDIARQIQKEIQRPKYTKTEMVDKEIQSDRMDDTARYSRFSGRSSWNPYLDLKYSSPTTSYSKYSSRNSSSSSLKEPVKIETRSSSSSSLKEPVEHRVSSGSSLKEPVVKDKSEGRTSSSISSLKDRADAARMSSSSSLKEPLVKDKSEGRTSSSISSLKDRADVARLSSNSSAKEPVLVKEKSDASIKSSKSSKSIPTSSKENRQSPVKLPPSIPKTSSSGGSSKMQTAQHSLDPINKDFRKSVLNMNQVKDAAKKSSSQTNIAKSQSRSRSTSIDSTSSSSIIPSDKNDSKEEKKSKSESDSRTSQGISEIQDEDNKPYKLTRIDTEEKPWWLNETAEDPSPLKSDETEVRGKSKIKHIESGEIAWWLQPEKQKSSSPSSKSPKPPEGVKPKYSITSTVDSGEKAWWLKSDSEKKSKKSSSNSSSEKDFWAQINSTIQDSTDKLAKTHIKGSSSSNETDFWTQINSKSSDKLHIYQKPAQASEDEEESSSSDELENYVINQQVSVFGNNLQGGNSYVLLPPYRYFIYFFV